MPPQSLSIQGQRFTSDTDLGRAPSPVSWLVIGVPGAHYWVPDYSGLLPHRAGHPSRAATVNRTRILCLASKCTNHCATAANTLRFLASDFAFLDRVETWGGFDRGKGCFCTERITSTGSCARTRNVQARITHYLTFHCPHPVSTEELPASASMPPTYTRGFSVLAPRVQPLPWSTTSGPILLIDTSDRAESNCRLHPGKVSCYRYTTVAYWCLVQERR